MLHKCFAGRAVPGDDVDDSGRQTDFDADFRKCQRGERRKFRWLENNLVMIWFWVLNFSVLHYMGLFSRIDFVSAGAIFHANMRSGKFHGMIWPTTPHAA